MTDDLAKSLEDTISLDRKLLASGRRECDAKIAEIKAHLDLATDLLAVALRALSPSHSKRGTLEVGLVFLQDYLSHSNPSLKVFLHRGFRGHYPVGTSAVSVAIDQTAAELLLEQMLESLGLDQPRYDLCQTVPLNILVPSTHILNDGNY